MRMLNRSVLVHQADAGKRTFDVIIIGGGSAGTVLAARLSSDAQRRVLLLEAGQNFEPDSYPPILSDANIVGGSPDFDWHYHSEDAGHLGHDIPLPRGRVIGGSSAVNGTVAMRARPADFARWAKRGIEGWSWEEVLAAYKALENTPTGDDAWHGRSGPLPIRQRTAEENTPSMRAFVEASEAVGLAHVSDFNSATQHGVGPYPLNVVNGVRINTGIAYLTIKYNFFDDPSDLDRLVEVVQLSRKIGRTAPISDLIDHEMAPGNAIDDGEALRANIVATVDAYEHPTLTVPMGADSDPIAVVDAWGRVRGIEALRVVDASIIPDIPSVPTNVTTIMVAERIAARLSA